VLFGGAAGGGKSHGQLIDALLYALRYPKSVQLMLRRSFPELEKSLIRKAAMMFPREVCKYNAGNHIYTFKNGSIIEFGYCDKETDVNKYDSSEYDVIRFDELTHFTEDMYVYLTSRCRGSLPYPRSIKSSTNPGNVGHVWVKKRFIDIGEPNKIHKIVTPASEANGIYIPESTKKYLFIPSFVQDNTFLMKNDPTYVSRLQNLSPEKQKALLYGQWDLFEGQFFNEWDRDIHVIRPFNLPDNWRRYVCIDYGLDMLAVYFIAVDEQGRAYVYKEIYRAGLIISEAAKLILDNTTEKIYTHFAPPDLWNRRQETGKSVADIFREYGIYLTKSSNDRVQGWLNLKEWLAPTIDEEGNRSANLKIFSNCTELIRTLPSLQYDKKNPNDVAKEPHELTHAADSIRAFIAGRPRPARIIKPKATDHISYDDQLARFLNY